MSATRNRGAPKRRPSLVCPECSKRAAPVRDVDEWGDGTTLKEGWRCTSCAWAKPVDYVEWAGNLEPWDDGRIRSPEDVAKRMAGALERAQGDGRLSALDRAVHLGGIERTPGIQDHLQPRRRSASLPGARHLYD